MASVIRGDDNFDTEPTLAANVPAFSAKLSTAQDIPDATATKVIFQTEDFDTHGKYDASTGRFTPTIAGKYVITSGFSFGDGVGAAQVRLSIRKNGTDVAVTSNEYNSTAGWGALNTIYIGSADADDYFEIWAYQNRGQATNIGAANSVFSAFKLSGA